MKSFREDEITFKAGEPISAYALDYKFNALVDYINEVVIPFVEQIKNAKVVGSTNTADIGKFHKNVGDGSTAWSFINADSIKDYDLSFSKLQKTSPGSLAVTDRDGKWSILDPAESEGDVLVNTGEGFLAWTKLTGDYLEDGCITSSKVKPASITEDNLSKELLATLLLEDSLDGDLFADSSITSGALEDGSALTGLTAEKLIPADLDNFKYGIYSGMLPDNFFVEGFGLNKFLNGVYAYPALDDGGSGLARVLTPLGAQIKVPLDASVKLPANALSSAPGAPANQQVNDWIVKEGTEVYQTRHIKAKSLNAEYSGNPAYYLVPAAFQNGACANDLIEDGAIGKECFNSYVRGVLGL